MDCLELPFVHVEERVRMGVPNSQLTTIFSAKYQLTTIFLANSQLTTDFGLAINFHFPTVNITPS